MSLYIIAEENFHSPMRIAVQVKSLKEHGKVHSHKEGDKIWVYKTLTLFKEGIDYTIYEWTGSKFKKSNGQPVPELSRIFFGARD